MQVFKSGFYTTSKKDKKPETRNHSQSVIFTQPQPFSQQSGTQSKKDEMQFKLVIHAITPTSQEKPRKQTKSALYQEVQESNLSGQMRLEQLIKVVLNLQKEIKKTKEGQQKVNATIQPSRRNRIKINVLEKRTKRFLEDITKSEQLFQNQLQKQTELINRLKKIEEKLQ